MARGIPVSTRIVASSVWMRYPGTGTVIRCPASLAGMITRWSISIWPYSRANTRIAPLVLRMKYEARTTKYKLERG